jgi:hypothetical protein
MSDDGKGRAQGVYEMLWDCEYCGTRKLLGKSHRHCPKCGAPQDPGRRYFPSEEEKVAVADHAYHGADRVCASCGTANSAAASFCVGCGAPTEGSPEVVRVGTPPPQEAPARRLTGAPPPPPRRRGCVWGCLGIAVTGAAALLAALLWTRPETLHVEGHSWRRSIEVERFETVKESGWCDSLPTGARVASRSRDQRGTEQVADGESCETVDVDDGDGTFHQEQRCETRYRSEPVYDDRCSYEVDRWRKVDEAVAAGADRTPRWPATGVTPCQRIGCRREGRRSESYVVELTDSSGKRHRCPMGLDRWESVETGSQWTAPVRVLTGGLDCDGLRPD